MEKNQAAIKHIFYIVSDTGALKNHPVIISTW